MLQLSFVVLWILAAAAMPRADQVSLKNGDRVTGSIVKKEAANLTIASIHFGTITIPWDQVESVNTDAPLYVSVGGAEAIQGVLSVSGGRAEFGGRSFSVADI